MRSSDVSAPSPLPPFFLHSGALFFSTSPPARPLLVLPSRPCRRVCTRSRQGVVVSTRLFFLLPCSPPRRRPPSPHLPDSAVWRCDSPPFLPRPLPISPHPPPLRFHPFRAPFPHTPEPLPFSPFRPSFIPPLYPIPPSSAASRLAPSPLPFTASPVPSLPVRPLPFPPQAPRHAGREWPSRRAVSDRRWVSLPLFLLLPLGTPGQRRGAPTPSFRPRAPAAFLSRPLFLASPSSPGGLAAVPAPLPAPRPFRAGPSPLCRPPAFRPILSFFSLPFFARVPQPLCVPRRTLATKQTW